MASGLIRRAWRRSRGRLLSFHGLATGDVRHAKRAAGLSLRCLAAPDETPLRQTMDSFLVSNYQLARKSKDFYKQNALAFGQFILVRMGREALTSDLVKDYANHYLDELAAQPTAKYPKGSPYRARAAAVSLMRVASWLAQEGIQADRFGQSLLKGLKKAKVSDNTRSALSDEEIDAILGAYQPSTVEYTVAVLMIGSGLRFNEARELRIGDIDFNGLLTVRPETSKSNELRTVDLHDAVLKELDRYLRGRPRKPESALFLTDEGKAFSEDGFDKLFRRIRRESGLTRFHAHLLRHTWATRFKGDLLELKRQGGWKSWKQVERYRHGQRPDRTDLVNPLALKRTVVAFKRQA